MAKVSDFGTSDFVTELHFAKVVEWGGFFAGLLVEDEGAHVYIWARKWVGVQPRHVLYPHEEGYSDWRAVIDTRDGSPEIRRYVGSALAPMNRESQFLTHGASSLLG